MPGTFSQMYVQTVFAVKYRAALIDSAWSEELFRVIGNFIIEAGGKPYIINGVADHVHCFFGIRPSLNVSGIMQIAKSKSSGWLNKEKFKEQFAWQEGFGCFTYSHSQKNQVYQYVANQQKHHLTEGFRDEYVRMLRAFEIEFDERFIFHDPL